MKFQAKSFSITVLTALIFTVVLSGRAFAATEVSDNSAGDRFSVQIEGEEKPVGGWSPLEINYIEEEQPEEPEIRSFRNVINGAVDDVFVNGASDVGYNSLSSVYQKNLYTALDQQVQEFINSETDLEPAADGKYRVASIQYSLFGLTQDEGIQVFVAYDYDHPAYYWISNTVNVSSYAVYMFTKPEYASVSARSAINRQVIDGVKKYAAMAEKGEDTLDKIAVIHDLVVTDVNYAYDDNNRPESSKWAHSVQGVFDNHKSVVCEGYADVFSLMMNYMDIPNYYIVGTAGSGGAGGGGGHAWNAVYDDSLGKYIYMDLTWDDCGENGYYYKYFGMPKTDFEAAHFKFLPTNTQLQWLYALEGDFADSFEDTYYYRGGFYCDSTNYADFAKRINTKIHRFGTMVTYLTSSHSKIGSVNYYLTGSSSYSYYTISYKDESYYLAIKDLTSAVDLSQAEVTLAGDVYAYTGSAIEPSVEKVVCNGIKLIEGLNYTVSYEDNINTGSNTAKVIITGKTRFSGAAVKPFSISGEALSESMVTLSASQFEYNGNSRKPTVTVTKGGNTLRENTDYTVSYSEDTVNAGTKTVTVKGKGSYEGTVEKTYDITPTSISGHVITIQNDYDLTYDGFPKTPPVISVKKAGSASPIAEDNYEVSYENNVDAGTATVKVTGKKNYSGTASNTFTVLQADIAGAGMELSKSTYEYTEGGVYKPDVTMTFNSIPLTMGTDYTLSYSNNTQPGNATVTATGTGNFCGTKSAGYRIVLKKSMENATVILAYDSIEYDGSVKKPGVTVKYGESTLTEVSEYTVSYDTDLINAGIKRVTVTGKGENYTGSITVTYEITPANISTASITVNGSGYIYTGAEIRPNVTVTFGGKTLVVGTDYGRSYSNNINAGTNTAKVTATGCGNYQGSVTASFSIGARSITAQSVSLEYSSVVYDGTEKKPGVTIRVNNILLSPESDYDTAYSNNINAGNTGNAKCIVTAKGNYTGSVTKSFTITKAAGSIRYGTTTVTKTFGDAPFTNALTVIGDGGVTYTTGNQSVATVNARTGEVTIKGAGSTYVRATVSDGTNYTYSTKTTSYTLTVKKIPARVITAPTAKNLTYTGDYQELVSAGTALVGTMVYRVGTSGNFSNSIPKGVNAGDYKVYYKVSGSDNYEESEIFGPVNVTIKKKDRSFRVIMNDYEYDGTGYGPSLEEYEWNGRVSYVYSGTDGEGNEYYSNEPPVNAGSYTVTVNITESSNYKAGSQTVSYRIFKAPLQLDLYMVSWSAGEEPDDPSLYGNYGDGVVTYKYKKADADDSTYTTDKPRTAGEYTVSANVAETLNYKSGSATYDFTIYESVASVEYWPEVNYLVYNGEEQELISAGSSLDGVMKYRLSGESGYSDSIPVGVNAGEYVVYYKAEGNGLVSDSEEYCVNVTIEKASPELYLDIQSWNEGDTPSEPVLSGTFDNDAVTIEYKRSYDPDDEYSETVPTAVGDYVIRARADETENYYANEAIAWFSIYPANGNGGDPGNNGPGPEPGYDPGSNGHAGPVTVSDNEPMKFYYEPKGEYSIGYPHAVPFWGKTKPTAELFKEIKVSFNGIDYPVSKVKINKKKCTLQILELAGADKVINKTIKKATAGSAGLHFTVIPHYVRDGDDVVVTIKKGIPKSVKVTIFGKLYKAKKGEFSYDADSGTINFSGNLDGSYTIE